MMPSLQILQGDCLEMLKTLPDESVHCCVTSPPYWGLRDYGVAGQIGLEPTPEAYVAKIVEVFREVRRVLRSDGTCWVNLGDSYASNGSSADGGHDGNSSTLQGGKDTMKNSRRCILDHGLKPKDLVGIPWRVAFALQADGWWLRQDIIWAKPNPMPESVTDRCTKAHEYVFLLSKSATYFYDAEAIKEPAEREGDWNNANEQHSEYAMHRCYQVGPTRNKRSVWTIPSEAFSDWEETYRWVRVSSGDVSGGMRRITSKDCPIHGCQDHQDDGREAGSPNRSPNTDNNLFPTHDSVRDTSSKHHEQLSLSSTTGCSVQSCLEIATPRNNQTRKTDPVLATNPSCNPSEEIPSHTDGTQVLLDSFDSAGRTCENSIWPDVLAGHLWERIPYHSVGKSSHSSSCRCVIYNKVTEKTSHFATFPTALVKPCILAGTSARGCCPKCGAPWERVVEPTPEYAKLIGKSVHDHKFDGVQTGMRQDGKGPLSGDQTRAACPNGTYRTTGWTPTCSCGDMVSDCEIVSKESYKPVPCTVLDPFGGSCTTGQVALELGCNSVLIELNESYVKLGRARCQTTPGLALF